MKSYARNVNTIKNDNRALIFKYVRSCPISRADISKRSGMSKSAVTMITNTLIDEGQLTETGASESPCGRKPILLDIVPDYRYAAGIALHRNHTYICVTDLKSDIIAYTAQHTAQWDDPYRLLDYACGKIYEQFGQNGIPFEKCIGIGVSAPGPLDYVSGKILNPPDFSLFHNIDVGDYLRKRFGLPVVVDNNAVLLTMQEYLCDGPRKYRNYMLISVSDGIGSAIMTDGSIYRGFAGFAGEIGHTSIHSDGIPCSCGNSGCLERYVTMKALKEKFGFGSYEKVVDDAYAGDHDANGILEYIAGEFSCAIINAVNLFDLDAVIIYGELSYRHEKLFGLLSERINRQAVITRSHDVTVRLSSITPDMARSSVCAAILNRYFEQRL